jgi:Phosphotransferase enzyme family
LAEHATSPVVPAELEGHPALRAWAILQGGRPRPGRVEVRTVREKVKSAVYRLAGVGPGGCAVIAKRCPAPAARVERTIYEEALPRLPWPSLRYHGLVEEGGPWCWLFLEDAGPEKFAPDSAAHRALAGRWLGRLHTSAARLAGAVPLPDRGPAHSRELLRAARQGLLRGLVNPALPPEGREVLWVVVGQCDALEAGWPALEDCCAGVPATLVHGDFRRKNVCVRGGADGPALFPVDWEMAGWGPPAIDLARSRGGAPQVDLPVYWAAVRGDWPDLDLGAVERLALAGTVFQRLAAICWECPGLASPWPEKAIASLRIYHAQVDQALRALRTACAWDGKASAGVRLADRS